MPRPWKCSFPIFKGNMTDRPTLDKTLVKQIKISVNTLYRNPVKSFLNILSFSLYYEIFVKVAHILMYKLFCPDLKYDF